MTKLTGANLIAGDESARGTSTFRSTYPRTGEPGTVEVHEATSEELDEATAHAAAASGALGVSPPSLRALLLRTIADELEAVGDELIEVTDRETGLGASPRLSGELARTTGQLRAFARLLEDGDYVEAIIDTATDAHPDVRRMLVPIGPIAVFGASNFPLAFSVAGGDTASALAAGCPVVVKSHSSHPETSELTGRAVMAAVERTQMPPGTFSLIHGDGRTVGTALVRHPAIKAVGFTGSLAGGRALHDVAASRPEPIPVYAEMGSLNPVFVTDGALRERGPAIAEGFVGSMTLGNGQFCTKPGLVFAPEGFAGLVAERLKDVPPAPMLNPRIRDAFVDGARRAGELAAVDELVHAVPLEGGPVVCAPGLLSTDLDTFWTTPELSEEHFGPLSVIVRCPVSRMAEVADRLQGSLTATIHAEGPEHADLADLRAALVRRAGRIVFDGFPTGVAVLPSMHHGGPYPATSNSLHTSVGMTAIRRFLRPVAFQNAPQGALPDALRDENPLGIRRWVDWTWTDRPVRSEDGSDG